MIEEILKSHLIPSENYIHGFADLTGLLPEKFHGFNHGISIGLKLDRQILDDIKEGPTKVYYTHYKEINGILVQLAGKITEDFKKSKIESITIPPTVSTEELDTTYSSTLRTDISHKMVATRAGLGWIGKTDLLITKKFGPRLRLVSILLRNPEVAGSKPLDKSLCGSCNICVDNCPAKAATGKLWDITTDREDFFDPWKCRDQCAEFGRIRLGNSARVCGMCVSLCPIGLKT